MMWSSPLDEAKRRTSLGALGDGSGKAAANLINSGQLRFKTDPQGNVIRNDLATRVGGNMFTRGLSMSLQRVLARDSEEDAASLGRVFGSDQMRY